MAGGIGGPRICQFWFFRQPLGLNLLEPNGVGSDEFQCLLRQERLFGRTGCIDLLELQKPMKRFRKHTWIFLGLLMICAGSGCRTNGDVPVSLQGLQYRLMYHGPNCRNYPYSCPPCPYYSNAGSYVGGGGTGVGGIGGLCNCPKCLAAREEAATQKEMPVSMTVTSDE
jgi:hypothetical protein